MKKRILLLPVGKTAERLAEKGDSILTPIREHFPFDEAIMLASEKDVAPIENGYTHDLKCNTCLVKLKNPFYGEEGYEDAVRALFFVGSGRGSSETTEILIMTSGGTEKMSSILRDCGDVFRHFGYKVTVFFGTHNKEQKRVIYTIKPTISDVITGLTQIKNIEQFLCK